MPQDPSDEPAEKLLRRIAADRKIFASAKSNENREFASDSGMDTDDFAVLGSGWTLATLDALCTSIRTAITSDPIRFANAARFALDILPTLTARRDQIQQLRQTILKLAVIGRLEKGLRRQPRRVHRL